MAVERNDRGQFVKGVSGNAGGRPRRRKGYLDILQTACTPSKWKAICRKAVEQASEGDKEARRWLSSYLLGQPTQRIETTVELHEIDEVYHEALEKAYGPEPDQN